MDNFISLMIGIVSSLVATIVFIVISELIRRVVLPWYEDKVYRGVRIDGKWEAKNDGTKQKATFFLQQKGDQVIGTYSHIMPQSAARKIEEYQVTGNVRDTYVNLTFHPTARDQIDTGTYVSRLSHDSSDDKLTMIGMITGINTTTAEVVCEKTVFKKEYP